jgi:pimeloyl-ACP methyl ester carboxylesterase
LKIDANGIRIFVSERGTGTMALVFLHYWGGSSRTWNKVIDALPPVYRTVAADFRGWGHSDAPAEGYALADMADDIADVVTTLNLTRYILVGHSMGGKVAQLLASRRPAGLVGLVLVAPAPPPPLAIPPEARAMMATAYASAETVAVAIDQTLTGKSLNAEDRAQVIEDSLRGAPEAKTAWPRATSLEDISAEVPSIDVPMIVIAGEVDKVESVVWLKTALLSRAPGTPLYVLPATGHLSPLESPREIAEIIHSFAGKIESKSSGR